MMMSKIGQPWAGLESGRPIQQGNGDESRSKEGIASSRRSSKAQEGTWTRGDSLSSWPEDLLLGARSKECSVRAGEDQLP